MYKTFGPVVLVVLIGAGFAALLSLFLDPVRSEKALVLGAASLIVMTVVGVLQTAWFLWKVRHLD